MDALPANLRGARDLLIEALPDVRLVYCFGSTARGDTHPQSDVDLAVLAGRRLEPLERLHLVARLSTLLGREADLLDLRQAPTVVKAQVLDGIVLYEASRGTREFFEARVLGELARLNESRSDILHDVYKRGAVHGA